MQSSSQESQKLKLRMSTPTIYLTVGELAVFVIGWNLVLEQVIRVAPMARYCMGYANEISNNLFLEKTPGVLVEYTFDPYPVVLVLLAAILVYAGKTRSARNHVILLFSQKIHVFE